MAQAFVASLTLTPANTRPQRAGLAALAGRCGLSTLIPRPSAGNDHSGHVLSGQLSHPLSALLLDAPPPGSTVHTVVLGEAVGAGEAQQQPAALRAAGLTVGVLVLGAEGKVGRLLAVALDGAALGGAVSSGHFMSVLESAAAMLRARGCESATAEGQLKQLHRQSLTATCALSGCCALCYCSCGSSVLCML